MFPKKCRSCSVTFQTPPTESQQGFRSDCHSDMQGPCCAPMDGLSTQNPTTTLSPATAFGGPTMNQHPQIPPQDSVIHWGAEIQTDKPMGQAGAAHPCRVSSYTPAAPAAAAARAGHELGWFGVKMHPGGCPGKQGCVLQFFTSHHPPAAVLEGESCLPTPSAAEQCRTAGSCREPACLACRRECGAKPCLVPRSSRPGAANCCWKEPGAW